MPDAIAIIVLSVDAIMSNYNIICIIAYKLHIIVEVAIEQHFPRNERAENVLGWLEYIIDTNQPLSCVGNKATRRAIKLKPISYNTFVGQMNMIWAQLKQAIARDLPVGGFGVVLDGWTHKLHHYIGIYANYSLNGVTKLVLIGCHEVPEANAQTAEAHRSYVVVSVPFLYPLLFHKPNCDNYFRKCLGNMGKPRQISFS